MNKNYFSDGIMRRMRQYTLALSNNAHSKDKDLENLLSLKKADEITQTVYDREVEKINQQIGKQGNKLLSEIKADYMKTFEKMREIAKAQISKAPTPEMVSTLQILAMLDKVSPEQFTIFLGIASPYTTQELYELWFKFRDDPNAEKMLSDFMQSDTASAARLIDEFESRFQHDHRYEREGKDRNTL